MGRKTGGNCGLLEFLKLKICFLWGLHLLAWKSCYHVHTNVHHVINVVTFIFIFFFSLSRA